MHSRINGKIKNTSVTVVNIEAGGKGYRKCSLGKFVNDTSHLGVENAPEGAGDQDAIQ